MYHFLMQKLYQFLIPRNKNILQVGIQNGELLSSLKPACGVGVYLFKTLHLKNTQILSFYSSLSDVQKGINFDYIILSSTIMEVDDIQSLLNEIRLLCAKDTKIIIDHYSFLWEPILRIAQKFGLRRKTELKNWVTHHDLKTFLYLSGYEIIKNGKVVLIPVYVPIFSWFFNTIIANMPGINKLCLVEWSVARLIPEASKKNDYTVSVIIPCRNEKGNVENAVMRCPEMGKNTELIFVEGNSCDGTYEEIKRIAKKYTSKNIQYCVQDGSGKGDAVRKGFEKASGDILMILDGDLTVPPEELPKFFDALADGKGEFVNGSRLIYGMESEAMRFLNQIANYIFAVGFSWLLDQRIKDTLCGTKVLFRKDYERIKENRSYFGEFDPFGDFDLLFGAAKQNLKIIDLPVHYKNRTYGSTQIRRFYHGLILLRMSWIGLWKFKFR